MMTDDQRKLKAIIEEKFQEATRGIRFAIEKQFDEQACDGESIVPMNTFYIMDDRFDKLAKAYAGAIARRSNAVTVGNLIDEFTETSS